MQLIIKYEMILNKKNNAANKISNIKLVELIKKI